LAKNSGRKKEMNSADFIGQELFEIADDLMKSQRDLIERQNELIMRLIDRVDWLEKQQSMAVGIKAL
jgi:hypothetical protein